MKDTSLKATQRNGQNFLSHKPRISPQKKKRKELPQRFQNSEGIAQNYLTGREKGDTAVKRCKQHPKKNTGGVEIRLGGGSQGRRKGETIQLGSYFRESELN